MPRGRFFGLERPGVECVIALEFPVSSRIDPNSIESQRLAGLIQERVNEEVPFLSRVEVDIVQQKEIAELDPPKSQVEMVIFNSTIHTKALERVNDKMAEITDEGDIFVGRAERIRAI